MELTIFHNPRCRKSREALELLRGKGLDPAVLLYLQEPPSRKMIQDLLAKLGIGACDLIRREESLYKELSAGKVPSDRQCLDWMVAHPILIQRPIVVRGDRAVVARPPVRVEEIMDDPR